MENKHRLSNDAGAFSEVPNSEERERAREHKSQNSRHRDVALEREVFRSSLQSSDSEATATTMDGSFKSLANVGGRELIMSVLSRFYTLDTGMIMVLQRCQCSAAMEATNCSLCAVHPERAFRAGKLPDLE